MQVIIKISKKHNTRYTGYESFCSHLSSRWEYETLFVDQLFKVV